MNSLEKEKQVKDAENNAAVEGGSEDENEDNEYGNK